MPIYKPGIETKEKIYQTSKHLFYENGYKKTTCASIAKASLANVGLIHYHFGGKGNLGAAIYNEYMKSIKDQVQSLIESQASSYDLLTATAVEIRVHTDIMMQDQSMNLFYMDILEDNVLYKEETVTYGYYNKLAESIGAQYDNLHLSLITYGNFGAQQGLTLAHNSGRINCTSNEFSDLAIELMLLIMQFEPEAIKKVQNASFEVFDKLGINIEKDFTYKLFAKT